VRKIVQTFYFSILNDLFQQSDDLAIELANLAINLSRPFFPALSPWRNRVSKKNLPDLIEYIKKIKSGGTERYALRVALEEFLGAARYGYIENLHNFFMKFFNELVDYQRRLVFASVAKACML